MKKQILWAGGLVLALAAGYVLGAAPWRAETTSAVQQAQVRIYDQNVEWFDGTQWHTVASVKELQESDPLSQANAADDGPGQVLDRPIGSVSGDDGQDAGQDPSTKKQTNGATTKTTPDSPKTNTNTKPNTNPGTAKPNTQPGKPDPTAKPKPTVKPGGDGEDVEWSDDFL